MPRKPAKIQHVKRKAIPHVIKSTTMKITAIISLYNSGRWLHNRINNLMETDTYKRGELFIYAVNAQSPDPRDDQIANQYAGRDKFHYEIINPCTVYGAWNHAIKKTSTPFITNANADDINSPDCYDKLIAACEAHDALVAYSDWYVLTQENQPWRPGKMDAGPDHCGQYNPDKNQLSCGHFPVWRRDLHDKVGYFDPSLKALGDADLWLRAWRMGYRNFFYFGEHLGGYLWRNGDNLWHRVDDATRASEWEKVFSRPPGKLDF